MSLAKKCDRCGKYYTHKTVDIRGFKVNAIALYDRETDNRSFMTRNVIDLCPMCLESFDGWLNVEKEKRK